MWPTLKSIAFCSKRHPANRHRLSTHGVGYFMVSISPATAAATEQEASARIAAVRPLFCSRLTGKSRGLAPVFKETETLGKPLLPGDRPCAGPTGFGAAGAGLGTREVGMSHMLWHSRGRQLPNALASQVSAWAFDLDGCEARVLLRPLVSLSEPDVTAYISEPDPLPWQSEDAERSRPSGLLGRSVLGVLCAEYCP